MSTGLNCEFIEIELCKWYYVLEDWDAPKNAWDWREYATAYGPFSFLNGAKKHLRDHHANPGGYSSQKYQDGFKPDEVLLELIKNARTEVFVP